MPTSYAGPPYRTLAEWASVFGAGSTGTFAVANVTTVKLGVGSYNRDVVSWVDDVKIEFSGYSLRLADFEPASTRRLERLRRASEVPASSDGPIPLRDRRAVQSSTIRAVIDIYAQYDSSSSATTAAESVYGSELSGLTVPSISDELPGATIVSKPGCYSGVVRPPQTSNKRLT